MDRDPCRRCALAPILDCDYRADIGAREGIVRKTWFGVPPCEHETLWMLNTKECSACWIARQERNEAMPFERGDEDTRNWTDEIEATTQEHAAKAS